MDTDAVLPEALEETDAWVALKFFLGRSKAIDSAITNNKKIEIDPLDLVPTIKMQTKRCEEVFNVYSKTMQDEDISDEKLRKFCRFTDGLPLWNFRNALQLVPGLVNVVSLADAIPLHGSTLPFNLREIARKVNGAIYFAPRRFTAVQLAFDQPRSRTLLFHTGRIVGTGTNGPQAARLAVARAIHAIATQAGVHIGIRRFSVINQVGAVALGANLDCDKFADAHSADSHFDKSSFVGLAWRPSRETICSEAYSTGKMNLPGSRRERHMLNSFSRMAPELFRFSSKPEGEMLFDEDLRDAHRVVSRAPKRGTEDGGCSGSYATGSSRAPKKAKKQTATSLWEDDDNEGGFGGEDEDAGGFGMDGLDELEGLENLF